MSRISPRARIAGLSIWVHIWALWWHLLLITGPDIKKVEQQKDSDDDSDLEIIDVDLSIDVNKMEASQVRQTNNVVVFIALIIKFIQSWKIVIITYFARHSWKRYYLYFLIILFKIMNKIPIFWSNQQGYLNFTRIYVLFFTDLRLFMTCNTSIFRVISVGLRVAMWRHINSEIWSTIELLKKL